MTVQKWSIGSKFAEWRLRLEGSERKGNGHLCKYLYQSQVLVVPKHGLANCLSARLTLDGDRVFGIGD